MTHYVQIVFSEPFSPTYGGAAYAKAMEDRYHEWYNGTHLREMMTVPGYVAGQRYELVSAGMHPDAPELPSRFMAIYEMDGDLSAIQAAMWPKAKGWAHRIPAAALPYTWQWWAFEARGQQFGKSLGDAQPEHVRLEFAEPMISGYGDEEYDAIMRDAYDRWYDEVHLPSAIGIDGVSGARRWDLQEEGASPNTFEWPSPHVTIYGLSGSLTSTLHALAEAEVAEAPGIPAAVRVDRWRWWTFKRLGPRITAQR